MNITNLTTYRVSRAKEGDASLNWLFVKIDTDEGISGWGEAGPRRPELIPSVQTTLEALKPDLIGQSVTNMERIWHTVYHRFTYFASRGFGTSLVAGIDIALWDINGKATGRPIYDLLGGRFHERVPMYVNSWFRGNSTPDGYAAAARDNVIGKGYAACKLDPFFEMQRQHRQSHTGQISAAGEHLGYDIVAAVREAVGPGIEILVDAHGHYNVPTAIRLANKLYEQSNIGWFEEPVLPESYEGLRTVREHTSAPICVGERLHTRYDFVPIFQQRLADYVMPDTVWTGGISEAKKIATMAEAYEIPIAPHVVPGGPICLLAAAHMVSTAPNFYRLEHSFKQIPEHHAMLTEPYEITDGYLHLNGKPGLGYELDEEWLAAHAVK